MTCDRPSQPILTQTTTHLLRRGYLQLALLLLLLPLAGEAAGPASDRPSVVLITVDALRADRLSCYGYHRPTSPVIDRLLARGARFTRAWTVEPLTNPALTSLLTSLPPHQHGATRNGLRMRTGLASLPRQLHAHGWRTAAVVSNWTLKHEISRLGDHFEHYSEVFTRRRWFGLFNQEATGHDVTERALEWLHEQQPGQPFFLWVHYVEPHAPYRFQAEAARVLGISQQEARRSDRYDTEVYTVDHEIGLLLEGLAEHLDRGRLLLAFAADHGESLGEHQYWGHGRHLYEPSLHIPMGLIWPTRIRPTTVTEPALNIDLAPTLLHLLDIEAPESFTGVSWRRRLLGDTAPARAALCVQAHMGAVKVKHDSDRARSRGLLEVGVLREQYKEIIEVKRDRRHLIFDLDKDPAELHDLTPHNSTESEQLMACFGEITNGLGNLDHLAVSRLDAESREQLRALGYLE